MTPLDVTVPAIAELAGFGARFVGWRWAKRGNVLTKPPMDPHTGRYASVIDPATWGTLAQAIAAAERYGWDGVGFVLNGDGIVGADLDTCRNLATGELTPWALGGVADLRSYAEVSPSGCGLKVFARVDPMPVITAHKRTMCRALNGGKAPAIELYVDKRFLCLTGNLVEGAPDEITDATEEVERLAAWLAAGTEPPEPPAAFLALLDRDEPLFVAWHHGVKLGNGSDETASGLDMSLAQHLRPYLDDDDLASVLRSYRYGQIGGGKLAGKKADRRIARVIGEVGTREERTGNPPDGMTHEEWQKHGAEQARNITSGARAKTAPEELGPRATKTRPEAGLAYDAELAQRPGGILQELVGWMVQTHKRPQPELALGGSLALLGLLGAHKYRLVDNGQDTRTNVNAVALAASVAGKDHPRRCAKAILAELGMSDFVSEDIASGQAIEGAFIDRFANLLLIDEYGHRIAAALDPRGSANEKKLIEVVTKLSTSAAGLYTHTRRAEHRHAPVPCTWDPCLVMFATTVEEPLWANMRSRHVADGSIARHLFFKASTDYPDLVHDVPHFEARLPEMVTHACRVLTGAGGELELSRRIGMLRAQYGDDGHGGQARLQPARPGLVTVPIDGAVGAELRRLEEEELALLRAHLPLGTNALVGRLVEHTKRLALICAVSDDPVAPALRARHVLWAESVAKQSLDTVLKATAENVADTPIQASRNKLLRDVRRTSAGGWVTRRDITRGSRWLDVRSRTALLAEQVDLGLVEAQTVIRSCQPVDEFRCA